MTRVYVGTCGWSYADWKGPVYPERVRPADMLPAYARRFTAVEVDATYYRDLPARTFAAMAARTPAQFRFTVKLPGSVTHVTASAARSLEAEVAPWRESVEPLMEAGKFACALAQFPYTFRPGERERAFLHELRDAVPDVPLAAEFRHRDWHAQGQLEFLRELGFAWTNVDEPRIAELLGPSADATAPLAYVRLHGRNAAKWFHGTATSRYDYEYTAKELEPWASRVGDLFGNPEVREVYVMFNNHARGQAVRNAEQFVTMLEEAGVTAETPAPSQAEPEQERLAL